MKLLLARNPPHPGDATTERPRSAGHHVYIGGGYLWVDTSTRRYYGFTSRAALPEGQRSRTDVVHVELDAPPPYGFSEEP